MPNMSSDFAIGTINLKPIKVKERHMHIFMQHFHEYTNSNIWLRYTGIFPTIDDGTFNDSTAWFSIPAARSINSLDDFPPIA
jgi:hypothetical protein